MRPSQAVNEALEALKGASEANAEALMEGEAERLEVYHREELDALARWKRSQQKPPVCPPPPPPRGAM